MKERVTCLRITAPDGTHATHDLGEERTRIGRAAAGNDPELTLDPDPQRLVSRVHCVVEFGDGSWTITDNASHNGTMLRRGEETVRVLGTSDLGHGDTILILGGITDDGQPQYWKLVFDDPFRTVSGLSHLVPAAPRPEPYLVYDWIQMRVVRVEGEQRTEIDGLSPQAHRLIRYLADLSRKNNGSPVACSHAELVHMLWGRREEWPRGRTYDESNLRNVINNARKRIERDPAHPQLLLTERNIGYRLVVRAEDDGAPKEGSRREPAR